MRILGISGHFGGMGKTTLLTKYGELPKLEVGRALQAEFALSGVKHLPASQPRSGS